MLHRLRFGQQRTEFKDRNRGQQAHEQEHASRKETEGANENGPVNLRRVVHAEGRVQEVAVQADHDDDEPLQPHADQNVHGNHEQPEIVQPQSAEPQHLRDQHIADSNARYQKRVGPVQTIEAHKTFIHDRRHTSS